MSSSTDNIVPKNKELLFLGVEVHLELMKLVQLRYFAIILWNETRTMEDMVDFSLIS